MERLFELLIDRVKNRNASTDQGELMRLIDDAVETVRTEPCFFTRPLMLCTLWSVRQHMIWKTASETGSLDQGGCFSGVSCVNVGS